MKVETAKECQRLRDAGRTLAQVSSDMGISTWMIRKYTSTPRVIPRRAVIAYAEYKFKKGMTVTIVGGKTLLGKTGKVVEVLPKKEIVMPYLRILIKDVEHYVLQEWCIKV